MKTKICFLFLLFTVYTQAQNTSYEKDIKHFIEINGTIGQYYDAISQLNDMLKEQYKDADVSEGDWKEVDTLAKNSIESLSADLVTVYKNYFTHEEIIVLNKHYENEVLQKFVNNVVSISDASQDASIVWSRSLYNELTDYLHDKGYSE